MFWRRRASSRERCVRSLPAVCRRLCRESRARRATPAPLPSHLPKLRFRGRRAPGQKMQYKYVAKSLSSARLEELMANKARIVAEGINNQFAFEFKS